ncbi:hypothetical protein U1Q18_023952, partial [Sarracenia purpurea var. burkii]
HLYASSVIPQDKFRFPRESNGPCTYVLPLFTQIQMEKIPTPSAAIESDPRSSSDLSWKLKFRSANSFRNHLILRAVSFRNSISSSSPSNPHQGDLSNDLESNSDLSWQAMFRSASFGKQPSLSTLSSPSSPDHNHISSPEGHHVPPPRGLATETPEHESNDVSCDTHFFPSKGSV